jgi:predicted metal-dependent phosphoesterase TrpH
MKQIDLHVHSTVSDGSMSPTEVVRHARERGLSSIALTDHDTCAGIAEGLSAGAAEGVEVIPGIELSVDYHGHGIHILGYFVDPESAAMERLLEWVITERKRRNRQIAADMQRDGIPLYAADLARDYPESVVGRPHIAASLVKLGLAESVEDAFSRYLNRGCPYYLKRRYIPLNEGLDVIRDAGGKAVFAHPLQYRFAEEELLALCGTLRDGGVIGMECLYSAYTDEQTAYLQELAAHFGFCVTGGSDFHGARKPNILLGEPPVPYALLERLKER